MTAAIHPSGLVVEIVIVVMIVTRAIPVVLKFAEMNHSMGLPVQEIKALYNSPVVDTLTVEDMVIRSVSPCTVYTFFLHYL